MATQETGDVRQTSSEFQETSYKYIHNDRSQESHLTQEEVLGRKEDVKDVKRSG